MNERIEQLAEQCWVHTDEPLFGAKSSHWEFNRLKFAELIVRECAELSVNSQYANTKSEYYEGFNEALIYVGNKIKQHFGVAE